MEPTEIAAAEAVPTLENELELYKFAQFLQAAYIAYTDSFKNLDYVLRKFVRNNPDPIPEYWMWVAEKIMVDMEQEDANPVTV